MPAHIYRASAGSGKTYTLASAWLTLALQQPGAYSSILAITFTRKATAEIKERLLRFAYHLAHAPADSLHARLLADTGLNEATLRQRAAILLSTLLHRYDSLAVSTIDSLFQRIISAYYRELGMPTARKPVVGNERVAEEVALRLLQRLRPDDELTHWVEHYVYHLLEEDGRWEVQRLLQALVQQYLSDKELPYLLALEPYAGQVAHLLHQYSSRLEGHKVRLRQLAAQGRQLLHRHSLEVADFKGAGSSAAVWIQRFADLNFDPKYALTKLEEGLANDDWCAKTSKKQGLIMTALDDGLRDVMARMYDFLTGDELREYNTLSLLRSRMYQMELYAHLAQELVAYRNEQQLQLVGEASRLIRQVHEGTGVPFLYERIGERYRHFLIDEYQDTSTLQWENLLPLAENALAADGSVLLVGDVKQSIYRFRGGNPNLLRELAPAQLAHLVEGGIGEQVLDTNYRSARQIVALNNALCRLLPSLSYYNITETRDYLAGVYLSGEQQAHRPEEGLLRLQFLEAAKSPEFQAAALPLLVEQVLVLLGSPAAPGRRGGDLLVLVSRLVEAQAVAQALLAVGIPVFTAEALQVCYGQKVRVLHGLLQYVANSRNRIALNAAMQAQAATRPGAPLPGAAPAEILTWLNPELPDLLPRLAMQPPYELAMQLSRLLGLYQPGQPWDAYLEHYLQLIYDYREESGLLTDFLSYYEQEGYKTTVSMPPQPDAVRIMTIHKAKGLQAPVVLLPFADWDMLGNAFSHSEIWAEGHPPIDDLPYYRMKCTQSLGKTLFATDYEEEKRATLLDQLNKLYVALTRAEDELYIWTYAAEKEGGVKNAGDVLLALAEAYSQTHGWLEDGLYTAGTAVTPAAEPVVAPSPPRHYQPLDWHSRLLLRIHYLQGEQQQSGERLHRLLCLLPHTPAAALIELGQATPAEVEQAQKILDQLAHHPLLGPYAHWQQRRELELLAADGTLLRPDVVYVHGQQAAILEYKTGQPRPEHRIQVQGYSRALQQMGYEVVGEWLAYVGPEGELSVRVD